MKEMTVVYVQTNEEPKVITTENTLKAMQELVDGNIEMICPFEDPEVVLICNEEGKFNCPPNRPLVIDGKLADVIHGDFFICQAPFDSEEFESLSEIQIEIFLNAYALERSSI